MTTTSSVSSSTTTPQLDAVFTNAINAAITQASQPLTTLKQKSTDLTVQKGMYNDLNGYLSSLQSSVQALVSTDGSYALKSARNASVTSSVSGSTVATANADGSAVSGNYTLSNITLAKEERVASTQQTYSDQALGFTGTFYLGGLDSAQIDVNPEHTNHTTTTNAATAFNTAAVASGQTGLGSSTFYVETRQDSTSGTWQFRLVDDEGNAQSIQLSDGSGYSSGWQNIPTGQSYDTGRGLSITFGTPTTDNPFTTADRSNGAAKVVFTAQGAAISVTTSDSLQNIATKINQASYADGNGVTATIIDNQLILSAQSTGADHTIQAQDQGTDTTLEQLGLFSSGGFANILQTSGDATFSLNDMTITRSHNDNLTDVLSGVTLNLTSDAEGKSATLNISADDSGKTSTINNFISQFNTLQTYLTGKMAVTKNSDGTYTRGALAGDNTFYTLRNDLNRFIYNDSTNSGTLKNLSQLGLSLDDNLKLTITDQNKLTDALANNFSSVQSLMDSVMGSMKTELGRYTGSNSYVDNTIKSTDDQISSVSDQITTMTARLNQRKDSLVNQYTQYQTELDLLTYQKQELSTIYSIVLGSTSTSA
jgi:flagellar hook-associated protein 2